MRWFRTYTFRLSALVAAGVTAAILGLLGLYQTWAAYLIGWAPYLTPQIARWLFWTAAAVLAVFFVILPTINGFRRRELWAEREELELSAIANLSVGKTIDEKYNQEPQLSRHRLLKDAVRNGQLQVTDMAGEKPNVHTLVSRESLREYASKSNNSGLIALISKWDRINPPRKVSHETPAARQLKQAQSPAPAESYAPAITQYVPEGTPSILFKDGWILNFNPMNPMGRKRISFIADGSIGEGKNENEFRWQMVKGMLEIIRLNNDLQNRFKYDPQGQKFICTNDGDAKGLPHQFIFRDRAVA
jgi:hypothetical protein